MEENKITALAREYAEWICPYKDKSANLSILDIRAAERLINFLLRRYCLVEKDKVREAFWRLTDKFLTDNDAKSFGAASVVLESFFPEIAKEVE